MKIRKIALYELEEFIESEEYKQFDIKPITPMRAASYLCNPYARPNDFVLYLLIKETKLLAFRSLFADKLNGEAEPFAWLSGNWVHPDYRRQGFSERLLNEALADWNNRLMFTNYAPDSLQLYLKTGKFEPIYSAQGTRSYLFAKTSKILRERFRSFRFILLIADFFICRWASFKVAIFTADSNDLFQTELIERPDKECYELLKLKKNELLFRRGVKSFKWFFRHPWLSTADKRFVNVYPFSSFSPSFRYQTLKIYSNHQFQGFMLYSVRDGHLKTLIHFLKDETLSIAANHLVALAAKEKIEMITALDPKLADTLKSCKSPFIHDKEINHRIYASFKPLETKGIIQSGDGDFIFS